MEKRILLVDDEPALVAALREFLSQRGFSVVVCHNGKEAVEIAVQDPPHLIIMDIVMPGMDGTEAAMRLRENERTKRIPIFFLTGVVSPDDPIKLSSGPNTVIPKPVSFEYLLSEIKKLDTIKN